MEHPPDVLMIGTGEYTTGYVHGKQSGSDKKIGVVALTMFDLQSPHRGSKIGKAKLAGTNGTKFPGIREHFKKNILEVYKDMKVDFESFPADNVSNEPNSYIAALNTMKKGDIVTIFTPDDTHFEMAKEAIQRGLHVLLTKPPVKTLEEQKQLVELARKNGVLVYIEYHKRFDPMYSDARERIRQLGEFNFYTSYMSQPKFQLDTFKSWAGISSDISYYLNSHHVDFHCWSMEGNSKPIRVVAMKSTGVAPSLPYGVSDKCEDTITLMVQWLNVKSGNIGTASYTASWVAPKADVHSQQRFFYLGQKGEINIDQAHRGYTLTTDSNGFACMNPLYMKYTTDSKGRFSGQLGYGYRSLEIFVDAVNAIRRGESKVEEYEYLPTVSSTLSATSILDAGRTSLDTSKPIIIKYSSPDSFVPVPLEVE